MPSRSSPLARPSRLSTIVSFVDETFSQLFTCFQLVSASYNFTGSGEGKYSFAAVNRFHYVDPETGAPVELYADHPEVHTSSVAGKLAVSRPTLTKRATYNGCSSSEKTSLVSAASAAQSYAASAYS